MLSVADGLRLTLEFAGVLPATPTDVSAERLGQVLAGDVSSDLDSPPFAKSLRDGYAMRNADTAGQPVQLKVVGEVAAGAKGQFTIGAGEAARIFTGAPIPDGADVVVMQEDCQRDGEAVLIRGMARAGQWILPRGAEYRRGDVVLAAGTRLGPAELGLLASVGCVRASIFPRVRTGILSTGSEIVEPAIVPTGSQIRNSNGPMLEALCRQSGACPTYLGIVRDDRNDLINQLRQSLDQHDITIVSGGVSVGDHDHLPHVLAELGVTTHFHQVAMKPGKPVLFGSRGPKLLFGLPGNPVSAGVCFELFVRPAIRKLMGIATPEPAWIHLPLATDFTTSNDRPTFFPARIAIRDDRQLVQPNGRMNSANLNTLAGADALVMAPAGSLSLKAGDLILTLPLGH